MTRKLEDLFDLPPTPEEVDTALPTLPANRETLQALDDAIDKVDNALPAVRGLEATIPKWTTLLDWQQAVIRI